MSNLARPRGPLPARVYWVRRLTVLGLALLLVVGIQRLLTFDGADEESPAAASTVGAPFELPTFAMTPSEPSEMVIKPRRKKAGLPRPDGPCDPADVVVTPVIERAHVGRPTQIILEVTTEEPPACTFEVTSASVAVNVSTRSGARELLWTTQDCPAALPETTVVARQVVPGRAVTEWDGRRSDERCSDLALWVVPGDYLVEAVALGGTETGEQEFELGGPIRPTVTRTVTPTPSAGVSSQRRSADSPSEQRRSPRSAAASPSATATSER
jgi:hypothetical protein